MWARRALPVCPAPPPSRDTASEGVQLLWHPCRLPAKQTLPVSLTPDGSAVTGRNATKQSLAQLAAASLQAPQTPGAAALMPCPAHAHGAGSHLSPGEQGPWG